MGEPQGYDRKEIIYRVGTFFLIVGIGMMIMFMFSESVKKTNFNYFCWGMILLIVGFALRAQYKKLAPPPSGRFSVLKKFKRKPKEEKKK